MVQVPAQGTGTFTRPFLHVPRYPAPSAQGMQRGHHDVSLVSPAPGYPSGPRRCAGVGGFLHGLGAEPQSAGCGEVTRRQGLASRGGSEPSRQLLVKPVSKAAGRPSASKVSGVLLRRSHLDRVLRGEKEAGREKDSLVEGTDRGGPDGDASAEVEGGSVWSGQCSTGAEVGGMPGATLGEQGCDQEVALAGGHDQAT